MKFKKIFLITLLLLAFLMVSAVSANDNLTDEGALQDAPSEEIKLEDANDGIVSSSQKDMISEKDDGTFTALQNKINNTQDGGTITLENDYAYDEGFSVRGIQILKNLTINGNGHTLDGLSKSRIFWMNSFYKGGSFEHTITLNNINFQNGYAESGGAILSEEYYVMNFGTKMNHRTFYLNINDCTFTNNVANGSSGGAICAEDKITITNSIFKNNVAKGPGGAVAADDNCEIIKCTFTGNTAGGGGAVKVLSYGHFTSCTFNSNMAGDGGAIAVYGDHVLVEDSKFDSNSATDCYGGAIFGLYDDVNTENCIFTNNKAVQKGGAIYAKGKANGCTFINNQAPEGKDTYLTTTTNCIFNTPSGSSSSSLSSSSSKTAKATPKLTVKKATFKVKVKIKKYSAVLKTNKNKAMKNVKLFLKVKGKTYTAKTNSKGKAIFKIKNLKKKGTYKATVTFKGNSNYNKVSKTVKIKVK